MIWYMADERLNNIDADTWRYMKSGGALDQIARDTHDRAGTFDGLTRLDAYDLYRIVDAAPVWDCVEPDVYDLIATAAELDPDDYDDADALMNTVNGRTALLTEDMRQLKTRAAEV